MDLQDNDDEEEFTLQNPPTRKPEPPLFEALPKGKQGLLLRGLNDCPGQKDLWDGAHVS